MTTASIAALVTMETVAIHRDQMQPAVHVVLDTYSRYGLSVLRLVNTGGGVARNVRVEWRVPLVVAGKPADRLFCQPVPAILPGRDTHVLVGASHSVVTGNSDRAVSGTTFWEDSSGQQHVQTFQIDTEVLLRALSYDNEEVRTGYELQKIPGVLKSLKVELVRIRQVLEEREAAAPSREPDSP
ncbi:hypothetical protein [Luteitalea sp. TBR-22]|uniref:hypothetical protein n=1 Tax=Luteitalea sp. TBR-22 TaxID=2802971 RepID=UPI001EF5F32B|nr:hypothetical protein [Luteitalea sp. TBR-22]